MALMLVSAMAMAQTTATDAEFYTVGVSGSVQFTAGAPGSLDNLSKGYTYTLNPDQYSTGGAAIAAGAGVVTPIINGAEAGIPMNFQITVTGAASVAVSFELPSVLTGTGAGYSSSLGGSSNGTGLYGGTGNDYLVCSFSPTSLFRDLVTDGYTTVSTGGSSYNPNVTNVFNVGNAGGTVTLWLGITVTVPANAPDDTYEGVVACSAIVTGL
jgi:hypothetical protein